MNFYYDEQKAEKGELFITRVSEELLPLEANEIIYISEKPFTGYPIIESGTIRPATRVELIGLGLDSLKYNEEIVNGEIVIIPPTPLTLEQQKQTKIQDINQTRDEKEQDYFMWDGSAFDSDASSAQRIALAAQSASNALLAGVGEQWSIPWTLADNTTRVLQAMDMPLIVNAFATWSGTVHYYASQLKDAVNAATDEEALEAINIIGGWPTPEQVGGV